MDGWHKPRILVVDDDESARSAIKEVLERKNFMVQAVSKADEAASLVRTGALNKAYRYDLIILDIKLGESSGVELMMRWREDKEFKSPVIVISGMFDGDELLTLKKLGIQGFLVKPFTPVDLIEKVTKTLYADR